MVALAKKLVMEGKTVKIFTARLSEPGGGATIPIEQWCLKHIGCVLEVTNCKDMSLQLFYDDRAIQVETNTGKIIK
jgi:hypothetical protein